MQAPTIRYELTMKQPARVRYPAPLRRSCRIVATAAVLATAMWVAGCGDDDGASVSDVCESACGDIAGTCGLPAPSESNCATACNVAGGLAPECADQYSAVVSCAQANPALACDGNSVSVTVSGECLDPLAGYLNCAAANILPVCVALPLQNASCQDQGLPRAMACVGTGEGCVLQAGAVINQQSGVGLFCCP